MWAKVPQDWRRSSKGWACKDRQHFLGSPQVSRAVLGASSKFTRAISRRPHLQVGKKPHSGNTLSGVL